MAAEAGRIDTPRRRRSVRTRITLAATSVVGIALILGAVLFGGVLRFALIEQVKTAVEADAESYAARIDASGVPAELDALDDAFVQVQTDDGEVVSASDDVDGSAAIRVPESGDVWTLRLPEDDTQYLVAAEEVDDVVVIAGRSVESVDESVGTVVVLLAVAVPVLIALVAGTVWIVVGRALKPVDRMRREVDEVTGTSLHRRIADPGGGDEVARLATTMNTMLSRLEHAQHSQRRFISDASHELRSPLASLRQYAEVATSHPDRVSAAELSEAILDEGSRLERLVGGMLVLARADEKALGGVAADVDLDDLMLREAQRLRDSTSLTVDASAVGPARMRGDEGLLGQIIRNLVDNAARHASTSVALTLTDEVLLAVDDDGAGIPVADRDRVFERFTRLDEARVSDAGGSGLGLAIVRELASAMGGSVRATSSPLGGARFEVRLPAAPDQ